MSDSLPIHAVLPALLAALRARASAVLVAPPGAGKTTAVAPALIGEPWCTGQILLLSPRRLAARAAAERMAEIAGEPVGRTIGYATRLDSKHGKDTRILVLTEGIFRNRIQADPELVGISAVLFDEIHERSLDSDFGLALALDAQGALRPDLRILPMSATLDGARFSKLLDGAPVIESEGRSHPLDIRYLGRSAEQRIEDAMAPAIRRALVEAEGDLLAFLPGVAEIERTAERLEGIPGVALHRLHGSLDPAAQRAAIRKGAPSTRKVVLATSIAETSLTIDGVRIVVDSGLARRARYDRGGGMTRLVTERASQAAVTQRAGRAARQAPGVCYRLWEEAATAGMPPFDPPEILEADLSALVLDCAIWGAADPASLRWLDPPPAAAVAEARERLRLLDALDTENRPTPHGRRIAELPLPPRLAHMMLAAAQRGWGKTAAEVAVLLSERGLGGNDVDIENRLARWRRERGTRADAARGLAGRWQRMAGGEGEGPVAACIALAFPDRIAKRRGSSGEDWASSGGRGFRLDPASPLAAQTYLAVAEVQGAASGARILAAAAIAPDLIESLFADRIETVRRVRADGAGGILATRDRRLGSLALSSGQDDSPDPAAVTAALLDAARKAGVAALPFSDHARALQRRTTFARRVDPSIAGISDDALTADIDDWLPPLLEGKRALAAVSVSALTQMLEARLGWAGKTAVDRLAPEAFVSPLGSHHAIDYAAEGGPAVELRVQALFGLAAHPVIAGDVPLVLRLTSPAGRPIQTTKDLPGFWSGSWAAVAKEMRGRYPRHPWPDDPAAAAPTLRTKRADAR
ncbi:ATP-dependent helicase HrpB [Sphingosinicella microcystinivorans]|uniref:Helicase n=1 Tax=Sphingosinicella microcystinivorans TaxID=335406 RepID=A0AAD1D2Q3_SPHMI|nr:ATP-dependent helicase HrpB [Sphingosinicella microcystinivorans]RKS88951.1 ATP-dependent helicase HrpB [Sphingosinicella microcystinivorans]BBE32706.1 helicase [Sphingosinicella microcystinivorans]